MSRKIVQLTYTIEGQDHAWYFTCPDEWNRNDFVHFVARRARAHARLHDWRYDTLTWGDVINEVWLGPEIEELPDSPIVLSFGVQHDHNFLYPGWNTQEENP